MSGGPKGWVNLNKKATGRPRNTLSIHERVRVLQTPREVTFAIFGTPRTKKNSRRHAIMDNGSMVPLPSAAFVQWQKTCRFVPLPAPLASVPYNCKAIFYREKEIGDAVGYYQGLADLLQHHGILADDKYIVQWDGSRLAVAGSSEERRVEVTLTPLE